MRLQLYILVFIAGLIWSCSSPNPKTQSTKDRGQKERLWTEAERNFIIQELNSTSQMLRDEIDALTNKQWWFREDSTRWNIAEIIEHLTLQNELHYREINAIANTPPLLQYIPIAKGMDSVFQQYATSSKPGKARWFLQPVGRFCDKASAIRAFFKARGELTKFAKETKVDLRKHFTFRTGAGSKPIAELKKGDARDLHQLLLIGIAHTKRHLRQLKKIKRHQKFPK
ncbi:hypothetical protein BKI52_17875 [marine bacterium AO1-C]|nr:hypothetical protein BKI52_17875 [marine bacterium AO1-C]